MEIEENFYRLFVVHTDSRKASDILSSEAFVLSRFRSKRFFKSADYTPPTALLTIRQFSRLCRQLLFLRFYAPLQLFNIFRRRVDPPAECHAVQAYRAQSDHSASVHTQEQPPYRHELDIPYKYATDAKVYVIDDKTHSTMLLASEY